MFNLTLVDVIVIITIQFKVIDRDHIYYIMLTLTRQQQGDLSEYERELFQNRREQLKLQVKDNHLTGASRIYENQIKAGQEICDCF